jgi:hypothetical protein
MKLRFALLCSLLTITAVGGAQQTNDSQQPVNFVDNYVQVIGTGRPPKGEEGPGGYGLARRAALLVAYQGIAEATKGVQLSSDSIAELQRITLDRITASVSTNLKACAVVEDEKALQARYASDGFVTLTCRVPLTGSQSVMSTISDIVVPEMKKQVQEQVQKQDLKVFTPPPVPPAPAATPAAPAAPDYDGLIIKVPAKFKPCLFPKILTDKGELVYSVNDVPDRILRQKGMAQYTNDGAKAVAILRDGGVQSPLTIDGFLSSDTEAGVKPEDAAKISAANKKTSFLSSARVVFVVAKSS